MSILEDVTVAWLAELLAVRCGVPPKAARRIGAAALLHDAGKSRIPGEILNKPGKLTAAEFEVVKTHTILGAETFAHLKGEFGAMIRNVCRLHHENWDSSGYWGEAADDVPPYVPIVSICDVYVALVAARPYKDPWKPSDAQEYIAAQSGVKFKPALVSPFLSIINGR